MQNDYKIKFDDISDTSSKNLKHILKTTTNTCKYYMEVNTYKSHLQNYLLHDTMEMNVKRIKLVLINLQIISKILQEINVRKY